MRRSLTQSVGTPVICQLHLNIAPSPLILCHSVALYLCHSVTLHTKYAHYMRVQGSSWLAYTFSTAYYTNVKLVSDSPWSRSFTAHRPQFMCMCGS